MTLFRGLVALRVPRFPLIHLVLVALLASTPVATCAPFLMALGGFITAYVYLRFFQSLLPDLGDARTGLRGDASDAFKFEELFPELVRPVVGTAAATLWEICRALGLCRGARGTSDQVSGPRSSGAAGGARAEADRRRALALRALDQRLHAAAAQKAPEDASHGSTVVSSQVTTVAAEPAQRSMDTGDILGETSFHEDALGGR